VLFYYLINSKIWFKHNSGYETMTNQNNDVNN